MDRRVLVLIAGATASKVSAAQARADEAGLDVEVRPHDEPIICGLDWGRDEAEELRRMPDPSLIIRLAPDDPRPSSPFFAARPKVRDWENNQRGRMKPRRR